MKEQSRQDYKKYFMQDRKKGFFGHRGRLAAFLICLVAVLGAVSEKAFCRFLIICSIIRKCRTTVV